MKTSSSSYIISEGPRLLIMLLLIQEKVHADSGKTNIVFLTAFLSPSVTTVSSIPKTLGSTSRKAQAYSKPRNFAHQQNLCGSVSNGAKGKASSARMHIQVNGYWWRMKFACPCNDPFAGLLYLR